MQNHKTIVLSGAGSGIGRATALHLDSLNQNYKLILVGRTQHKLEETRHLLKHPEQHKTVAVDVNNAQALRSAFFEIGLDQESVTAVIANAGIGGENHYGENDRWDEIISTNLTGVYKFIQESLPYLKANTDEFKNIVITSSVLAHLGIPHYSAYCASKAGLLGLTRSFAAELAPHKILVNALCPGWVKTEMAENGIRDIAERLNKSYESVYNEEVSRIPLQKMSEPHEIAATISFLISNAQTSITGQTLNINGGAWM